MLLAGCGGWVPAVVHGGVALLLLSSSACSSPLRPEAAALEAPPAQLEARRWRGSDLRPGVRGEPVDYAAAIPLRMDLLFVRRIPEDLPDLPPDIEVIVDLISHDPIVVEAEWLRGSACAKGALAEARFEWLRGLPDSEQVFLGSSTEKLPPHCSYGYVLSLVEVVREPGDFLREYAARGPVRRSVELSLWRSAREDPIRVAIAHEDLLRAGRSRQRASRVGVTLPVHRGETRRELVLLNAETSPSFEPLLLMLPSVFESGDRGAYALLIRRAPDDAPGSSEEEWLATASPCELEVAGRGSAERALAQTLSAAHSEASQAAALTVLVARSGAQFAGDLLWHGRDADLLRLAASLPREDGVLPPEEDLGWLLDQSAYQIVLERVAAADSSGELEACLLRSTGELGRDPAGLADLLQKSASRDAFDSALRQENLFFLESSAPSSRVRAFDWLQKEGVSLEDFDPLASREDRRAALRRWQESQT